MPYSNCCVYANLWTVYDGSLLCRCWYRWSIASCIEVSEHCQMHTNFNVRTNLSHWCTHCLFSYLCELTALSSRARILGLLGACGIAGGILAGGVAILTVPLTGQMVMLENKEHFSAWHRYLLLITFPTLGAILGLFWLPESPRYLLESGREVEALAIYQVISSNTFDIWWRIKVLFYL